MIEIIELINGSVLWDSDIEEMDHVDEIDDQITAMRLGWS